MNGRVGIDRPGRQLVVEAGSRVGNRVANAVVAVVTGHDGQRLGGLDRVDVGLDVLADLDLVLRDELVDGPVLGRCRDVVNRGRARVGARVGDVPQDMPVDAAVHVEHVAAARTDQEADELARVRLVLGELRPRLERRERFALHAVAARAGIGCRGELGVIGGRDGLGEGAQHDLDQLSRAVELGLDPAGDPRLDVALGAGHVLVRAGLVGRELGRHCVTAAAEVGRLGPVEERHGREGGDAAHPGKHEQQREQPATRARQPQPPATQVEPRPVGHGRGRVAIGPCIRRCVRRSAFGRGRRTLVCGTLIRRSRGGSRCAGSGDVIGHRLVRAGFGLVRGVAHQDLS